MNRDLDFLYNSLLLAMGQEYEHYQELLKTLQDETLLFKNSTLADILDFNKRKEVLLFSLNMAEETRTGVIKKLFAALELDEPASMAQLAVYAQNNIRQKLIDYQEKFADIVSSIKTINEKNMDLINALLSHTKNTLNYINILTSPNANYTQHGHIKAGNLQGRLISQEG
jgi:flagellar biosynthesis/type III secretory pathway chaperone